MTKIKGLEETYTALRAFAAAARVGRDWHEPAVAALVRGQALDNASGDTGHGDELVVVLKGVGGRKVQVQLNLASVLALASETR